MKQTNLPLFDRGPQATSLLAYAEIKDQLGPKQAAVLAACRQAGEPLCNAQIAARLAWPINTVTPRVLELRNKGLLTVAYARPGPPAGRKVLYWRARWPD